MQVKAKKFTDPNGVNPVSEPEKGKLSYTNLSFSMSEIKEGVFFDLIRRFTAANAATKFSMRSYVFEFAHSLLNLYRDEVSKNIRK